MLYIAGGIALTLVALAWGLSLGRGKQENNQLGNDLEGYTQDGSTASRYSNTDYYYELTLPPKWSEIKHSPLLSQITLFDADGTATLEVIATKAQGTLEAYLASTDETNKTKIKINKTTPIKVAQYDGLERSESWSAQAIQTTATYIKIQDLLYAFILVPAGGKNTVTNEVIVRDYHSTLASFRLTDTSQLGQDLKSYTSKLVEGLAFKPFTLQYPQSWVLTEKVGTDSLDVSIYRNNYELTISQKAVGGAVCLFSDSPAFEGSSGDLRNKQYTEITTQNGGVLRRYFNANAGAKSTIFFCEKQAEGPYFQTPLSIGGLAYYVPAKYDGDIVAEMDEIVKTISPQ